MKLALAIAVSAIAVFVVSSIWYVAFAAQRKAHLPTAADERPAPWKAALELLRSALVASLVAGLAAHLSADSVGKVLLLGLALFLGFPFVLLTGSVIWDNVNWRLAAIHAGDWLLKLLVISVVVGLFR
ncbi:DUF1761 domain-containing protein [Kribbella sp. NPDC051587]|uniref:DUF1761 domain-containing protein n=1 Tax=Kribbella sp. NPDC051587 TaxID=3364119 RepID=UPI00378E4FA2